MSAATLVCVPGGGSLAADTFDAAPLGRIDYSFRRAMTARGHAVVLTELPGVADGIDGDAVTVDSAGYAAAVASRAAAGPRVGVGHSLGGAVVVRAQAAERPFDALVLLGYSPGWRSLEPADDRPVGASDDLLIEWTSARLAQRAPALWSREVVRFPTPPGFSTLADVPPAVAEWAEDRSVGVPRRLAQEFGIPEPRLRDASSVDVPVLLVFGEVDAADDPAAEPAHYPRARVTLECLPGSGHAHHLSSARTLLWDRVDRWIRAVLPNDAEEAP